MRIMSLKSGAAGLAMLGMTGVANGQWAVFDATNFVQMVQQVQQMKQQYDQLQQTHASFNKLTNLSDFASILNNPQVRSSLPQDSSALMAALQGQGGGAASGLIQKNTIFVPDDGSQSSEITRGAIARNAGEQSLMQQTYDGASQRIAGIDQLRQKISQSEDPKTIADLQARIQVESTYLQNDMVRMQAINSIAAAQARADDMARIQAFHKKSADQADAYLKASQ